MQDGGRCFTSYISNCVMNERLYHQLGATSDADYRMKLQQNATKLIRSSRKPASAYCNICFFSGGK